MDELETLIKEQLRAMPESLRTFIGLKQWETVVTEIAQKNNLSESQRGELEYAVLLLLVGLSYKEELQETLKSDLAIPDVLAHDITEEINTKILKQVEGLLPQKKESGTAALLEQAEHVLETKISPQNNTPAASVVQPTQNQQQKTSTPQITTAPPTQNKTAVDQTLSALIEKTAADTEWLARKNTLQSGDAIIQKKYPGQDPYREPTN